jgi:FLVCR family feline leukemia virus subgroup C receptor-related protein
MSYFTSYSKKFKFALMACSFMVFITYLGYIPLLYLGNEIYILINAAIWGFFYNPGYPICIEYLCELSYPVGEAVIGSVLNTLATLLGSLQNVAVDFIISNPSQTNGALSFGFISLSALFGFIIFGFTKGKLKRLNQECSSLIVVNNDSMAIQEQNQTKLLNHGDG